MTGARAGWTVSQHSTCGGEARVHSPRDMGKRSAEARGGACDLGHSLTTTGVFYLHFVYTRPLSDASRSLRRDSYNRNFKTKTMTP